MCRVLGIKRSSYYQWTKAKNKTPQSKDAVIVAYIRKIERENDNNYGVRRVHQELNYQKIKICKSKVQRIMHQNGIKAEIKKKHKPQTTKADPNAKYYPNLLEQDFKVKEKNKIWLSDITYIRTGTTWSYLAAIMDLGRRKIVGWAIGSRPTAELAHSALKMAIEKEKPQKGLIHHSDRGSQYTSNLYTNLLKEHKITGSMSRKGNPYDNAPMESFFGSLKTEHVHKKHFSSLAEAKLSIKKWLDYYYARRRHSALGGISPFEYELRSIHLLGVSA